MAEGWGWWDAFCAFTTTPLELSPSPGPLCPICKQTGNISKSMPNGFFPFSSYPYLFKPAHIWNINK